MTNIELAKALIPDYTRISNGVKFWLDDPNKTKGVRVVDLLMPIAEISRYNFHLASHYSVAEHCYHCSMRCSSPIHALLHDLSEAIIGDVPAPVKKFCPDYKVVEHRVETWVFNVFNVSPIVPTDLKKVDLRMLTTEQMFFGRPAEAMELFPPYPDVRIGCWKPVYAALKYFERLQELTNGNYTLDTVLEVKGDTTNVLDNTTSRT